MWGNRRQSCILDSTPWILDSNYWISDLFSGLRFQIPVVSEMPNSYSCIQDSKAQDSGFHRQKISKIPDTTGKNSPDAFTCGECMCPMSLACAF